TAILVCEAEEEPARRPLPRSRPRPAPRGRARPLWPFLVGGGVLAVGLVAGLVGLMVWITSRPALVMATASSPPAEPSAAPIVVAPQPKAPDSPPPKAVKKEPDAAVQKPATPKPLAPPGPRGLEVSVDTSEAPELATWGQRARAAIEKAH